VIGHSLGGGTATLIAAELRNALIQRITKQIINKKPSSSSTVSLSYESVHRISAIVFASPAIISESLANAFLQDRLLIHVINGCDVIPRYNKRTMAILANEMKEFSSIANEWMTEDKMDLSDYALSVGKASDIHALASEKKRLERFQRLKGIKDKKKSAAAPASTTSSAGDSSTAVLSSDSSASSTTTASSKLGAWVEMASQSLASTVATFKPSSSSSKAADSNVVTSENTTIEMKEEDNNDGGKTVTVSEVTTTIIAPASPPAKPSKPPKRPSVVGDSSSPLTSPVAPSAPPLPASSDEDLNLVIDPSTPIQTSLEEVITVVPGPVVHLYRDSTGNSCTLYLFVRHSSLVIDVTAGDGEWDKICSFLNVPVPSQPFPRSNDTAEFIARLEKANEAGLAAMAAEGANSTTDSK
jgi:hypothetical protein